MSPTKRQMAAAEAEREKQPTKDYVLVRGTHTREEDGSMVRYAANTEENKIVLTEEEAKALGARVQLAESQSDDTTQQAGVPGVDDTTLGTDTTSKTGDGVTNPPPGADGASTGDLSGFADLGWRDAVDRINTMSAGDLTAVRTMEEGREKPRTSVLEAIDAREKELAKQ